MVLIGVKRKLNFFGCLLIKTFIREELWSSKTIFYINLNIFDLDLGHWDFSRVYLTFSKWKALKNIQKSDFYPLVSSIKQKQLHCYIIKHLQSFAVSMKHFHDKSC